MKYDLHIHSCLSPCAEDDMTVNNIVNMALLNELSLIAISDHNSLRHQRVLKKVAQGKINILYAVELESREHIHILAYFQNDKYICDIQNWIDQRLPKQIFNSSFYGHQYLMDENDFITDMFPYLLLNPLDASMYEIVDMIHSYQGIAILAHAIDRRFGIIHELGKIPYDLDYDGIEVNRIGQKETIELIQKQDLSHKLWLLGNDAHELWQIKDEVDIFSKDVGRLMCKK